MSVVSKSKRVTIASAYSLTGSSAVAGDPFDVRNNTAISLVLDWSKGGSATALLVRVEGTQIKGDWSASAEIPIALDLSGSISSGVGTAPVGALRYSLDTGGRYHLPVDVAGFHQIRVKAHETGTPGGTLTIHATGVQEAG
jgi:hypothetical protein